MRARRLFPPLLALGLLLGCTQLRTPTGPAASGDPAGSPVPFDSPDDGSPVPFPSVATSAPPSQDPGAPAVAFDAFAAGTDLASDAVTVTFRATPTEGHSLAGATLKYDDAVLAAFTGAGPYTVQGWNPHVVASVGGADLTPLPHGRRTLRADVTDDQGKTGTVSVSFDVPLVLRSWALLSAMPSPTPTPTPSPSPSDSPPPPLPFGLSHTFAVPDGAVPPNFLLPWGTTNGLAGLVPPFPGAWAFDPAGAGAWTRLALTPGPTPSPTAAPVARVAYGLARHPALPIAYALGGLESGGAASAQATRLALQTLLAAPLPALSFSRLDPAAAVSGDQLFVLGGSGAGDPGQDPLAAVESLALDPATGVPPTGAGWAIRAPMANPRTGAVAWASAGKIWVFGGGVRPIEIYDPAADAWSAATKDGAAVGTPEVWQTATLVPAGDRLLFLGMLKPDGQAVDKIYSFDPQALAWQDLGPIPALTGLTAANRPVGRLAAGLVGGSLYVLGGLTADGSPTGAALKALVL